MNVPKTWHEPSDQKLDIYIKAAGKAIKLIDAYDAVLDQQTVPVTFYDYTQIKENFLKIYDAALCDITETNKLIDGEERDPGFQSTAVQTPIFHQNISTKWGDFYLSAVKTIRNDFVYSIQAFKETNKGFFCAQTIVTKFDEKHPLTEIQSNDHINQLLSCLAQISK